MTSVFIAINGKFAIINDSKWKSVVKNMQLAGSLTWEFCKYET